MNRVNAAKLLNDVHGALENMRKRHFLIDGTLLGAVREGDFIAHDLDVDMGVFAEEWSVQDVNDIGLILADIGIMPVHQLGDFDTCFELSYRRDDIKIDLFFYRRVDDLRIFHAFKNGGRKLPDDIITYAYPAHLIENLAPMIFQFEKYPAPADPIAVLVHKYGEDWRTPVKKWDWAYGPKNVIKA